MSRTKEYDPTVAARIPATLREKLLSKHPNSGDISRLIRILLEKYAQRKILGVSISPTKTNE